ncbi:hypothetical protein ACHQM5_029072 [Ranunculus cassubicifolius]
MDHLLPHRASALFSSNPNPNALLSPPLSIHFSPSYVSTPHPSFVGIPLKQSNPTTLCHSTNPGSPDSESDPPLENTNSDVGATFSKAQDKMQIFLAVLFWMSLFFWNCALDGKNDDGPNMKSRFKR